MKIEKAEFGDIKTTVINQDGKVLKRVTQDFKYYGDFKAADDKGALRIKGYASTFGNIDRQGEIISPKAFDETITEYMTNPVLLINHENNTKSVIGHCEIMVIDKNGLYVEDVLTEAKGNEDDITKIKEGNLKAFSIGGYFEYEGNLIVKVHLYEHSIVAIGANGEALFTVKSLSDLESSIKNGMDRNQALKMLESINTSQVLKEDEKQKAIDILEGIINPKPGIKLEGNQMTKEELEIKEKALATKEAELVIKEQKILSYEDIKKIIGESFVSVAKEIGEGMKQLIIPITGTKKYKFFIPIDGKDREFIGEYKTKETLTLEDKQLLDCLLSRKVMTTGGAATGAEFIPAELANQLIAMFRVPETLPSIFMDIAYTGPGSTYMLPIDLSDPTWYLSPETSSDTGARYTASTPGTGKVTFTFKKLVARIPASEEMNEDSIIPILDIFRAKLAASVIECISEVILDGDTTATHQDSDVTASTDRRKAWKGLRKLALAVAGLKVDLATFSISNIRSMRKAMGKYGIDKTKLCFVVGSSVYNQVLNTTEFSTADKAGIQAATILNGVLSMIDGIPVIASGKVREDLNASGVYDGITTTKTYMSLVRKDFFLLSTKRELTIKQKEDLDDSIYVNASVRKDFQPVNTPSATYKTVSIGYNIAS